MLFYVLYGLVLFCRGDFHGINAPRMIFKGGVLGGMQYFHHHLYLNGTVPFDTGILDLTFK